MSDIEATGNLIADKTEALNQDNRTFRDPSIDLPDAADRFDHEANSLFNTAGPTPVAEALEDAETE